MLSLRGKRPTHLGAKDGRLRMPGSKPNCVCSHATSGYGAIDPLKIEGDAAASMAKLLEVIRGMRGAEVIEDTPGYIYAEFTTPLLGFVDDVEFLCDTEAGVIHCRSASRLGYSDLGANRKRIEAIRAAMQR